MKDTPLCEKRRVKGVGGMQYAHRFLQGIMKSAVVYQLRLLH